MKIAIASGKGGTGKTTLATNLACSLLGMGEEVQYLDCDVEEPNGHIFLKPDIQKTQSVTIPVPQVDTDLCNGCGQCGQLCQYSAIVSLKSTAMTFEQLCHACGGCRLVCPTGAITERPKEIGFVEVGSAMGVRFGQGRLKVGDIHTPPLIKAVKARSLQRGIVIIDAPPGTSCPVIEAVKGCNFVLLVTEPTPFGLHDLKLAVNMTRALRLPFAVVVNRGEPECDLAGEYCRAEGIDIAMEIRDDRRIAEAYSEGRMIVDVLPKYREAFLRLYKEIAERLARGTGKVISSQGTSA